MIHSKDPDIAITSLRAGRQAGLTDQSGALLTGTPVHPAVLREIALAMNYQSGDKAVRTLVAVANHFDGDDRWLLEAIGIGALGKEKEVLAAWETMGRNKERAKRVT